MTLGVIGRKLGMTRLFDESGAAVPVTVVQVEKNRVAAVKTVDRDGYSSLQVTTGERKASHLTKAQVGHYAAGGIAAGRGLWEWRIDDADLDHLKSVAQSGIAGGGGADDADSDASESEEAVREEASANEAGEAGDVGVGTEFGVELFEAGQKVDVTGTSIGKGFQGGVKRHNFTMQDATHGNSLAHRAPGSIGQNQTPGRVFKGKRMAGHMGARRRTTQNLQIVRIDQDKEVLMIKGAVPGPEGGDLMIKPAVKVKTQAAK